MKLNTKLEKFSCDHLIPDIRKWPIFRLSQHREAFIEEIIRDAQEHVLQKHANPEEVIAKTLFQEKQRIKLNSWKVDPPNEKQFWNRVQKKMAGLGELDREGREEEVGEVLNKIVRRYAQEIVGSFKVNTYLFARRFLTLFFKMLFNRFFSGPIAFWGFRKHLKRRICAVGKVKAVRNLLDKGVIVLVPTHSSNLDSIYIGYAIDSQVGLPSFSYGAGLNLFNAEIAAYFMNRLGAYRVDRRKKNPIYLATLKSVSRLSIYKGVHSLFFPGGTRSRSGMIEQKLKLGLLGTAVEAERLLLQTGGSGKVYIVPVVISYPNILEAESLIQEHLRRSGKTKYIPYTSRSPFLLWLLKFIRDLFGQRIDTYLSFGAPLDILGNEVDEEGRSRDVNGKHLRMREYFENEDGVLNRDFQRESIYTQRLSEKISAAYLRYNVILPGHLLAWCAFELIRENHKGIEFYEIFKLDTSDSRIESGALYRKMDEARDILLNMDEGSRPYLSFDRSESSKNIAQAGSKELKAYHYRYPIRKGRGGVWYSESLTLLYFYHNRLSSYPSLGEKSI